MSVMPGAGNVALFARAVVVTVSPVWIVGAGNASVVEIAYVAAT
jgi:hypothetical protein